MGLPTIWVGEAADGTVGDHIIDYLRKANVGTDSVDRFSEGVSPVRVFAGNDKSTAVDHKDYPKSRSTLCGHALTKATLSSTVHIWLLRPVTIPASSIC